MSLSLFVVADIIGIIAFAISGFLAGVRHKLDLLGIIIVASLTALGGGIIRDMMLDRTPFAFSEYYPALTVIITVAGAFLFKLYKREEIERKWTFVISDTIGLVAFSITGTLLGIAADFNFFGIIIVSFLTAIGGGVTRDTLINQVPTVLTGGFYGTIALIIAVLLMGANVLGVMNDFVIIGIALFGVALRLVAYAQKWQLPKLKM
ncbi:MAG: trimeric intracellular cation channel family protein [Sulfurimonadaceae bacterium]|nr:trimeric intracellular cation channel family protein [Sulfurimonadaceae bacterium]